MLREIVFDTETTGLSPDSGHRIVEIGAIELINHLPTGKTYHQYINPERDVPEEVVAVHGLTEDFLKNYPTFREVADQFIEFIGDDGFLVAHNASFDMKFVNYQLKQIGCGEISQNRVIDTLDIARKKFPGAKNNLDALCRRFSIDNSSRVKHGALLDSELLAEVYLELLGGAEPSMLAIEEDIKTSTQNGFIAEKQIRQMRVFTISEQEVADHEAFLQGKLKDALWLKSSD